jgi:hypothetical protein
MEFGNIILSEVSLAQKAKISMFSLCFADCRPETNAAILWDMGHTKGRLCKVGIGQGKKTNNLNVVDVFNVQELL